MAPNENEMWMCKTCGEVHERQFETCWKCDVHSEPMKANNLSNIGAPEEIKISTKILLILCTIFFGVIGVVAFFPLLMSSMIFDSPGSDLNPINWIIFISAFTFSPVCLLSILFSWGFYYRRTYGKAKGIFLLPLVNILVLSICIAIS